MIRLLIDSSADFTPEEIKAKNLAYVPLSLHFDDECYLDGIDLTRDEFYEKLVNGETFPKTSQPSPEAFLKEFEAAKEAGDDVICILISSAISGTVQSATLAKSMCEYDKIHIVDSLNATFIINIMVDYALRLIDEGKNAEEIVKALEDLRSRTTIYIGLETLEYLYKGGRLSRTTATIGNIANLKPGITVSREGKVVMFQKSIGKNKSISNLIKTLNAHKPDPNFEMYTVYSRGTENCEKLQAKLEAEGYKITKMGQMGGTIGAHLGPGIYGVIYIAQEPQDL